MSKHLTAAQLLLCRVAAEYRQDPASWAQGWGYLTDGTYVEEEPYTIVLPTMRSRCPDIAIAHFGSDYGGWDTVQKARDLIFAHMKCDKLRQRLWTYNDDEKRTVEEVIAMLEGAAGISIVPEAAMFDFIKPELPAAQMAIAA